jgi:hypothetical protein
MIQVNKQTFDWSPNNYQQSRGCFENICMLLANPLRKEVFPLNGSRLCNKLLRMQRVRGDLDAAPQIDCAEHRAFFRYGCQQISHICSPYSAGLHAI